MRKRISEQNKFPEFDLYNEYRKIDVLLSETKSVNMYNKYGRLLTNYFTIEEYIDYVCFNDWNLRGTFTSITEMRQGLGIQKGAIHINNVTENHVLDFLQYALNCVYRAQQSMKHSSESLFSDDTLPTMIWDNVEKLTSKLNCTIKFDKKNQEFFIVYNNVMAEIVSNAHKDIAGSILEYIQIDNRGDLKRKGEILCTLYKRLEACSEQFKGTTYKNVFDDTKLLFNKSGVRHNVDKDSIACATFLQMDNVELEKWYDRIFDMFLSCMEISRYLDFKSDVDNIKRGISV